MNALVYNARIEDFGIIPIEAYASSTPVIGPEDGFMQYQISGGKGGVLLPAMAGTIQNNRAIPMHENVKLVPVARIAKIKITDMAESALTDEMRTVDQFHIRSTVRFKRQGAGTNSTQALDINHDLRGCRWGQ